MKDRVLVGSCKGVLRVLFRILFRIDYRGLENIPAAGPALIIPNHQSYLDPLFVGAAVRRSVRYMAMKKLFRWSGVSSFLRFYGAFPVNLRRADKDAIKACLKFLRGGEAVIIFPEGGRARDGKLMDFYQGFARIALLQQVPIVPVTIAGAHQVWSPAHRFPRFRKVSVTFHPPIYPSDFEMADRTHALHIVDQVKQTIESALEI
ncbi:MAG TPA: lysophospholipid acyltransferase family protein [Acidobacteriota bacterium]|nr:lysophospholipid acyltransferase family protein [Acidobacteriota bacterium]